VAQLGARMHYAVPRIFHEAGMLERLYTDSYVGNKPWLARALAAVPKRWRPRGVDRLLGRSDRHIPAGKVTSFDLFGLKYARARRKASDAQDLTRLFASSARRFCERVIAARPPAADVVWAFNGAALELFRWAKERGMRCVLEQTITPRPIMHCLLAEELERWPGWEPGLESPPGSDLLAQREEEEWQLADRIIAGSHFVVDGVRQWGGPMRKCTVVPYGVDTERFAPAALVAEQSSAGRLRVLFAGGVGLRKGAPYLLNALRELGPQNVEGRFAARVALAPETLLPYRDVATFLGPVPRSQMPTLYRWADVLVLPSVCEGSATVVYEALAAGVYVITTPNAGSVLSGASAFGEIVPIRSAEAIASALRRRRDLGPRAKQNAGAVPLVSLENYRDCLLNATRGLV
jgi:glycosyltransferase involved in cell wall biosynthesis